LAAKPFAIVRPASRRKPVSERRRKTRFVAAIVVSGCALGLAACGSSNNGAKSTVSNAGQGAKADLAGTKGGHLEYLSSGDVDYLDPGLDYFTFGYMVQYAVNRPLYSFKPNDTSKPVPDLASAPPEIAPDGKTVTVHLRSGVKFSPPVNREVTSADVKYAFERAFTKHVANGYAGTYFGSIVGAPAKPNTGDYKPISGLETPDDHTLVIRLKIKSAVTVAAALVMPITIPVPKEYAQPFDRKTPSTYDQHVVFTGPYMVRNDAQGNVTGRKPGKQIEIVRNPNWDAKTDYRPAYLDSITIQEGNTDLTTAAKRVLNGSHQMCCDNAPPPAVLKQAVERYKSQVAFISSGGTHYLPLNTKVKPFDDINVRKAVSAAIDRQALRQARGGPLTGDIATGFLPPSMPGSREAGGLHQASGDDYNTKPAGDMALAKKYMLAAKADGVNVTADGKYAGGGDLLAVAVNADPDEKIAQVAQDQFAKLGINLKLRLMPQDTMFTKFCNEPSAKVAVCLSASWYKDFLDPQAMLDATFNGDNILAHGNVNWPQLNDPKINAAMARAAVLPAGAERNQAWAQVNNAIVGDAAGVPWVWDKTPLLASKDVKQVPNAYTTVQDLAFSSLK
jgi:peptide/nickel transport system substrate-binding protein